MMGVTLALSANRYLPAGPEGLLGHRSGNQPDG